MSSSRSCGPGLTEPEVVTHARSLLGRRLFGHGVTVRITEVEAYGGVDDPASHAFTRTARSEVMYGPPWRLYVYQTRHHFCANIVTGPTEQAAAVLLRAGEVVDGIDRARQRRGEVADWQLARGPGNLAKALGITLADLGVDLRPGSADSARVRLGPVVRANPPISCGPRVGVARAADVPWRFWLTDERSVSAYRRSSRA